MGYLILKNDKKNSNNNYVIIIVVIMFQFMSKEKNNVLLFPCNFKDYNIELVSEVIKKYMTECLK